MLLQGAAGPAQDSTREEVCVVGRWRQGIAEGSGYTGPTTCGSEAFTRSNAKGLRRFTHEKTKLSTYLPTVPKKWVCVWVGI